MRAAPSKSRSRTASAVVRCAAALLTGALLLAPSGAADASNAVPGTTALDESGPALTAGERPAALREVGFDQRPGTLVPLDLPLRDETGREVALGEYFGKRPVLLMLGYYGCPMLCPLVMDGLVRSLRPLRFTPGSEFEVVTVSIDPSEKPAQARERREKSLARYARPESAAGWHFLTGERESIEALASAVGFRYSRDPESGQYAHAAGVVILSPQGQVARYLFGAELSPRDLRLAFVEAAEGKVGGVIDQVLLFCFHYDPAAGAYSAVALSSLRIGGVLTVLAMSGLIGLALWRERSRPADGARG